MFKKLLLFSHILTYSEQQSGLFHDSDTTDLVQNGLYTSYDNSEFIDNAVDDDPFCNIDVDQSTMFDIELSKSTKKMIIIIITLDQNLILEIDNNKPRLSNIHSFNKFPELFDLANTDTVYGFFVNR